VRRIDPRQIQEAFKLALSLTLFYWLALWMDWDLPKYGALAIVLISLGTAEASVGKGALRVLGTTAGLAVGMLGVALFAQEPWLNLLFLSSYLLFVGYRLQASRFPYAWFVAGFLPPLVWATTYGDVDSTFHFAVARYLETTAGVLIYSLVTLLVWPRYAQGASDGASPVWPGFRALLGLHGKPSDQAGPPAAASLDPVRLRKALFPPACFAAAYVFWMLVDPPTGPSVPNMASVFGLLLLMTPMSAVSLLLTFLLLMWVAVAPVYFFLMPRLDTGLGLLAFVFGYAFLLGWLGGWKPMVKLVGLALFATMAGISNEQTYSFLGFVNGGMMFALSLGTIAVVQLLVAAVRPDEAAEARFAV
jgi:uncharacterized membrane protein YccC